MEENDEAQVPTASWLVWVALIATAVISFWCQATVTEERFVPALNVVSHRFGISSDIAGATLMAAGASSPELFSSFLALFVTHSSLGLGTVFGSEVFNQLIICAGAVYASPTGRLPLDQAVVTREVSFYALAIVTLYLAVRDTQPVEDDPSGMEHLIIGFGDAALVLVGYVLYVLVCANMEAVVIFFTTRGCAACEATASLLQQEEEIVVCDEMPFLQETPKGTSTRKSLLTREDSTRSYYEMVEHNRYRSQKKKQRRHKTAATMMEREPSTRNRLMTRPFQIIPNYERPSDHHGLYDIEEDEYTDRLSCFLWQRSSFYDKARLALHGWHLRWFCLLRDTMHSLPDRTHAERHRLQYPATFSSIVVDRYRRVIHLQVVEDEGDDDNSSCSSQSQQSHNNNKNVPPPPKRSSNRSSIYLLAPSDEILNKVLNKMEQMAQLQREDLLPESGPPPPPPPKQLDDENEPEEESLPNDTMHEDHDYESLIEYPAGASRSKLLLYVLLLPFRALIHFTVPDVRTLDGRGTPTASLTATFGACFMCLVWLVVGSYAMVTSLEALAALLNIPDALIGYTVSAAGTSLPNYVASAVAARKGFGNMAVSNALGSNTFNIMIGLGLPWVLYTSLATGFKPYDELRNEGITQGVLILGGVLLLLVVVLLQSGFVLHQWHGHLFVVTYVGYLVYVVGQVYWW